MSEKSLESFEAETSQEFKVLQEIEKALVQQYEKMKN